MKRNKIKIFENTKNLIKKSKNYNIYLINIYRLNSEDIYNIRKFCYNNNIIMKVIKNNIFKKIISDMQDDLIYNFYNLIKKGPLTIFLTTNNLLYNFLKEYKTNDDFFIGAIIEKNFYNDFNQLSKIKSKNELILDIINNLYKNTQVVTELGKYVNNLIYNIINNLLLLE